MGHSGADSTKFFMVEVNLRSLQNDVKLFIHAFFYKKVKISPTRKTFLKGPRHIFSFIIFEIFVANDKTFALEPY